MRYEHLIDCLGAAQNLWVISGQCNLKIEVTKSPWLVYNSREKSATLVQIIDAITTDTIQKFHAEDTNNIGHRLFP